MKQSEPNRNPTREEFEAALSAMINHRPITLREIRERNKINGRPKYPYEEISATLNNLSMDKINPNTIREIINEGERKSWKRVGIKKLYGMIKTPYVKQTIKELYNL